MQQSRRSPGYPRRVAERYGPKAALIVVDVQNDFADPGGSLFVKSAAEILPMVNSEARIATEAGAFVVYTQDWHPESTPHFAKDGGVWPVHCVGGTWGAEFHATLDVVGPAVKKGSNGEDGYSGFSMKDPTTGETIATELEGMLRERGIEQRRRRRARHGLLRQRDRARCDQARLQDRGPPGRDRLGRPAARGRRAGEERDARRRLRAGVLLRHAAVALAAAELG